MTALQSRTERPPAGLERGFWPAPRWAVAAIGIAVIIGALGYLVWRIKRYRTRKSGASG